MTRAPRLLVPLAFICLAAIVWLAVPRRAPLTGGPAGLEVLIASPRGEVGALHSIDVVFDEPMVPLGSRGTMEGKPPLVIEPRLDGSFSWIGSRALTFVPREPVPDGTRITARVPRGVRSLEGRVTTTDFTWEIVAGRARLVASAPPENAFVAAGQPLYLVFTLPPAAGAEKHLSLEGSEGVVPLERIEPDTAALGELLGPDATPRDSRRVLAVRPSGPMAAGARFTLRIRDDLPFGARAAGLAQPIRVPFTTYGPPGIVSASGQERAIELVLGGPVEADTLRAYVEIRPAVRAFKVRAPAGTSAILEGDFRPGTAYTVLLRAGLPSLLGARLARDEAVTVYTAHLWPSLRLEPSDGYVPLGKDVAIRIEAANIESLVVSGAWVPAAEVPARLDPARRVENAARPGRHGARGSARRDLPAVGAWRDPAMHPDSAMALQIPLSRFGAPPGAGRVLHVRVRGRAFYPNAEGERVSHRDDALLQFTDLGMSVVAGGERSLVWVTRLSSGEPVEGAEVSVFGSGERILATQTTDASGIAWLPGVGEMKLPRGGAAVFQVRAGDDAAWLALDGYELGVHETPAHSAYLFSDRPLYRPGETVHWVALLRNVERGLVRAPTLARVAYRVVAPGGIALESGTTDLSETSACEGRVALPAAAAPGHYQLVVAETPEAAETRPLGVRWFQVEEYRLPRFEARVETPDAPVVSGQRAAIEGRFSYLGGGPLAGAAVRWTITRTPDWSRPERFAEFSFQDERPWAMEEPHRHGGPMRVASGEGRLEADGTIRVPVVPDLAGLTQDQVYTVEMGARDITDRSAYDAARFVARRAELRAGARARHAGDETPEEVELSSIVLDLDDEPVGGVPVRWQVHKREWKTVRVRRLGGIFGYENVPRDSLVASGRAPSDTAAVSFRWTPPGAGAYAFSVEAADARGRTTRARADIYVSGRDAEWYRYDEKWIELKPDRESYDPGDTARVLVPTPVVATNALFLLLDEGIRSARYLPRLVDSPRIAVPLGGVAPAGAWVQAILVGPRVIPQGEKARERLPYYAWGRTLVAVSPGAHRLRVAVSTDRSAYEPRQEVAIAIAASDSFGAPAPGEATVAVVDDAIYELAGMPAHDPVRHFFPLRDPGAGYRDLRWMLHLPVRGEKGSMTPGGDGGESAAALFRRRFSTTALWAPRVPIGADGNATVRFRLPDDLTRYRVQVLVASGFDRFGYAESKLDVRKPLEIEWAAPRFVRAGDRVEMSVGVRSRLERKSEVTLRTEASGARLDGHRDWKLRLDPGGAARVSLRLKEPRPGGVTLRLRAEGGGATDAVEVVIPFDEPLLWEREFHAARVDSVARTVIRTTDFPLPGQGGLSLSVAPSMLSGLSQAFAYVIDYPYGCLEQYSSMLLGLAAEEAAGRHLGTPPAGGAERDARVERVLAGIGACVDEWQVRSWPSIDSPPASTYTTGYALYATTRAIEEGLRVPGPVWEMLGEATREALAQIWERAKSGRNGAPVLASQGPWLLWALSEADRLRGADSLRTRLDDIEALLARTERMPLESRIVLLMAARNVAARDGGRSLRDDWSKLAAPLLEEVRSRHTGRTGRHVWVDPSDPAWGDGIGGSERTTVLFMRLLAAADPADRDLPAMAAWLMDDRKALTAAWSNNHVSALALDQMVLVAAAIEGPPAPVSGSVSAGDLPSAFAFGARRDEMFHREIPLTEIARRAGESGRLPLVAEVAGGPVYLEASLDRARPALAAPAREEGLIVARSYVDSEGRALGDRLPAGEPLFVHLAVVVSRETPALVVEDPLPAGLEALNLEFRNAPRVSMARDDAPAGRRGFRRSGAEAAEAAEGPTALRIAHRELRDRSARLFAQDVAPGVYHVYYPAVAVAAGEYAVPGARAEFLYSPEIYATSAAQTIRIERKKR